MATAATRPSSGREVVWRRKVVKVYNNGQLVAEYRLMSEKQAQRFFIILSEARP